MSEAMSGSEARAMVGERFMRSEGQMRVWLERMEVKMLA